MDLPTFNILEIDNFILETKTYILELDLSSINQTEAQSKLNL